MKKMGEHVKFSFNSPVVLTFTIICLVALLLNWITGGWANDTFFSVYHSSLLQPLTYVRMIGHVFGHANWDHFIGNIMLFLVVGPMLEEKYGSSNLAFVILTTAIVTGIAHCLFFPGTRLLGASGVVFAFILLASFTGFKEGELPLTFILVAAIFLGQQIVEGVTLRDDISNMAHIAGGIIGAAFGYFFNKGKEPDTEDDLERKSL